ncbi:MAG: hypothetical protein LBU79_04510 [Planctomycetota bacterium]|jgi:hypothetical protein|nr:hypothetical protein [Planctomycetota bacterium]
MLRLAWVGLLLLLVFPGCQKAPPPPPADGISRFPSGVPLREGDLILAKSHGLIGALFASQSQDGGRFSHAALVYREAGEGGKPGRLLLLNYRPTGMEHDCYPEDFFTRYNRLALVRYQGDFQPEALSASARLWLARDREKRIPPDYRLDYDQHQELFCLELPGTVYRDNALPDPFPVGRTAAGDALILLAGRLFNNPVTEVRSPSAVLGVPGFELLAEWVKPDYDLRYDALNQELVDTLVAELVNGYRPGKPNVWGRLKLRQVFLLYNIVTRLLFWRPRQDLPGFLNSEVVDNAYMLYSYVASAKKQAQKKAWLVTQPCPASGGNPTQAEDLETVRRVVRDCLASLRPRYLVYPGEGLAALPGDE